MKTKKRFGLFLNPVALFSVAVILFSAGCGGSWGPSCPSSSCASAGMQRTTCHDCCNGLHYNSASGTCEENCIQKDGDCFSLASFCCGGLICSPTIKTCIDCLELGNECEDSSSCCQPTDSSKGAFCDMNMDVPVCSSCQQAGSSCSTDFDCCESDVTPDGKDLICASTGRCDIKCNNNTDCTSMGHNGWICISGECKIPACANDLECGELKCCAGACKDTCGYGAPTGCKIVSPQKTLFTGQQSAVNAIAFSGSTSTGASIIPNVAFSWQSDSGVVSVTEKGGLSAVSVGRAVISAKAGDLDCGSIAVNVITPAASGTTVIVLDESTGLPIPGTEVLLKDETLTTDENGLVVSALTKGDLHVFKKGYNNVSILGVNKTSYIIHLPPSAARVDASEIAGGFAGKFDYSALPADGRRVVSGTAELTKRSRVDAGEYLQLAFQPWIFYFLDPIDQTVEQPVFAAPEDILEHCELKKSEGAPLDIDTWTYLNGAFSQGMALFSKPDFLPEYRVAGERGYSIAWGAVVGLSNSDITNLISYYTPCINDYGTDFMCALTATSPFTDKMSLSSLRLLDMQNQIPVVKTPCVKTTGWTSTYTNLYCENVPGMIPAARTAFIADYKNFPSLNLAFRKTEKFMATFKVPSLPMVQKSSSSGAMAVVGVDVPGIGFTTLGFDLGVCDKNANPGECTIVHHSKKGDIKDRQDGELAPFIASPYNGLEGNSYKVQLMSFMTDTDGIDDNNPFSWRFYDLGSSPNPYVNLSGEKFLGFAEGSSFTPKDGLISGMMVDKTSFNRYIVKGATGTWIVYSANSDPITLPERGRDLFSSSNVMIVESYELKEGITLPDLVSDSGPGAHLDSLADFTSAFSTIRCLPYAPECKNVPPQWCNPACRIYR